MKERILFCVSLAAGFFIISQQSLWIDEAHSALKAMQPDLASFFRTLVSDGGSDLQMPGYMLWLWGWEKIFGHSEYALRLANLPWWLLAQGVTIRFFGKKSGFFWVGSLLFLLHPFVWYYLDEARPYAMQMAGATLLAIGIFEAQNPERSIKNWFLWGSCGAVLMGITSLLAFLFSGTGLIVLTFLLLSERSTRQPKTWLRIVPALAVFSATGIYYLWTLCIGARATNGTGGTGWSNLLYVSYELLGFSGVGPSRIELRQNGAGALRPYLPELALYGLASCVMLVATVRELGSKMVVVWATYLLPPVLLILMIGVFKDFRVLGRHFTPVLPVILLAWASCLAVWHRKNPRSAIGLGTLLLLLMLTSSLCLRLSPRHGKDNYRGAAKLAKSALAQNKIVWWAADLAAAKYYQIPFTGAGSAVDVRQSRFEDFAKSPLPNLILLSKPDVYDSHGDLLRYLHDVPLKQTATLQSFTIWEDAR
ncbi:MAG: hypothetical protein ABIT76_14130 [Chthoniobacterales bacterium]